MLTFGESGWMVCGNSLSLSVKDFSFSAVSRTVSKLKQKALVKKKTQTFERKERRTLTEQQHIEKDTFLTHKKIRLLNDVIMQSNICVLDIRKIRPRAQNQSHLNQH